MDLNALVTAIKRQEEALVFDRFDMETAWQIGSTLRSWAETGFMPVVIDISLFNRRLFFAALPGSVPDNEEWVRRKRNVVQRYHQSSYRFGRDLAAKNDTMTNRYGLPQADYAEHGGAFPITLSGTGVIGAIVVSGLPQEEDHMLIVRALCDVLGHEFAHFSLQG
ncbi:heme-degrading domain-containing protein [Asaia prunellae]|uniref:heme-degrading domain-containing protein n=1 Tax=Asaia prunellae TaxID=610245 RepID=UPI00047199DE|nr:heme-degrading domain-containing protein [Asaia prunellae]